MWARILHFVIVSSVDPILLYNIFAYLVFVLFIFLVFFLGRDAVRKHIPHLRISIFDILFHS